MKLKLFILILVLQTAWLLGTVIQQEHALANGKVIMLETRPVDPRDMLRGDYLRLNYKISNVPTNLFLPPVNKNLPRGTTIYVALMAGTNQFYEVVRASTNQFKASPDEVLLKGKSTWWWNATNTIHVEYGLERYYVAEGAGNPTGELTVQAVVPASGHPKIKELFVDGKPYAEAMKNERQ